MTRDEAIAKAEGALGFKTIQAGAQSIEARKFVDMAVSLGVLKLDESKCENLVDRVAMAMFQDRNPGDIWGPKLAEEYRRAARVAIEAIDAEEQIIVGCSACGWGGKMGKRDVRHKQCPSCAAAWVFP